MTDLINYIAPYPSVNIILRRLLSDAEVALGDQFIGMYIHGSIATGDFEPERSDIDFVVVTKDELSEETLSTLNAMHEELTVSGLEWATRLEGTYIPQRAIHRYDPKNSRHPALSVGGDFGIDGHGSDWVIQRHIIREHGIVMAGPSPKTLIDPVRPNELRGAVQGILREWWSQPLPSPERFNSGEYQSYAVLTMCRALHTLYHGTVVSKPAAAQWALPILGERWGTLIREALARRHGLAFDHLVETLDLIEHVVELSQQFRISDKGLTYRPLRSDEVHRISEIDPSELIERVWRRIDDQYQLVTISYQEDDWPDGYQAYSDKLRETVASGGTAFGAFTEQGSMVGFATLNNDLFGETTRYLLLDSMFVSRTHRGAGIGRQLVALCAEQARQWGADKLYLCAASSESTIAFYRAIGCVAAQEVNQVLYDRDHRDIQLELDLGAGR